MINHIKGDLFTTEHSIIVHGVNCQGVMGSGVAGLIKKFYPKSYEEYREYYKANDKRGLLGRILVSEENDKHIVHAFTQYSYGRDYIRYMSYDAMDTAMFSLNLYMNEQKIKNVSMPKIGAGLGGGNWNIIEPIIHANLIDKNVYIYSLED